MPKCRADKQARLTSGGLNDPQEEVRKMKIEIKKVEKIQATGQYSSPVGS
jgi:hypothetical protein